MYIKHRIYIYAYICVDINILHTLCSPETRWLQTCLLRPCFSFAAKGAPLGRPSGSPLAAGHAKSAPRALRFSKYMGGCQNYGPLLGLLKTRCRIILRTQKGTILLTTTYNVIVIPFNYQNYDFGRFPIVSI